MFRATPTNRTLMTLRCSFQKFRRAPRFLYMGGRPGDYKYHCSGPVRSKTGQRYPPDKSLSGGEVLTKQTMLSTG